jgi:Metallo-beta-lactamase superfamily
VPLVVDEEDDVVTRPTDDELEISLFGQGYGESVAVHLPGGRWVLVDSCRDPETQRPAGLAYLEGLGVDVKSEVDLVVATHWHQDHVNGLSECVAACRDANVAISQALQVRELFVYAGAQESLGFNMPGAIRELRSTMETLVRRSARRHPILAQASLPLLEGVSPKGQTYRVVALSPSPAAVQRAFAQLARTPLRHGTEISIPEPDHNAACVVLQVVVGDAAVLLGSDLEESGDDTRGWQAVVGTCGGRLSEFVKIAHHGSVNGSPDCVWRDLVVAEPVAALTHFHNGGVHLPTSAQVAKLCSHTGALYSTSRTEGVDVTRAATRRVRAARVAGGDVPAVPRPGFGQVHARRRPGDEAVWRLICRGSAQRLG